MSNPQADRLAELNKKETLTDNEKTEKKLLEDYLKSEKAAPAKKSKKSK